MSLWKRMFGVGRACCSSRKSIYVVDAACLASNSGSRGRLPPAAQMEILKQLARFSKRETISIVVAFEGNPLDQVSSGGSFQDIPVYFAEDAKGLSELMMKLIKKYAGGVQVVVVTSDRDLEKRLAASTHSLMRGATFRKAIELAMGGREEDSRSQGYSGGNMRRPRRPMSNQNSSQNNNNSNREEGRSTDTVRELIDLVE